MADHPHPETRKSVLRGMLNTIVFVCVMVAIERAWDEHYIGAVISFMMGIGVAVFDYEFLSEQSAIHRRSMMIPIIGMVISALAFISFAIWWNYGKEKQSEVGQISKIPADAPASTALKEPNPQVFQVQFAKIKQLSDFIGKDEDSLRKDFDFWNILSKNISVQNIRIRLRNEGRLETFKYNFYTEGDGSFIMLAMEGKYHFTPTGPHIDEGPHDVLFLVTTKKYQDSQNEIIGYINSPLIPESIKTPLAEYKKIVDQNFELMIRVLNKRMNEGDDFFIKSQDYGGPYYGIINNDYAEAFNFLKPKADVVVLEIAKYLKTN